MQRFNVLPHLFAVCVCVFVFLAPFYLHYADGLFLWYFVDNFQHLKCYLTSGSGSGMKRRNVEGVGEVDEEPK